MTVPPVPPLFSTFVVMGGMPGWHATQRHATCQMPSTLVAMLKKAKIRAIREPQNMFHGLVPAEILKEYCDQYSIKETIIPDIMTYDHPHRERSGRVILQRRIFRGENDASR